MFCLLAVKLILKFTLILGYLNRALNNWAKDSKLNTCHRIFSTFSLIFLQLGGFYSAEDADSLPSKSDTHKKEGAFCVWEEKEIRELLQDERATNKSGESIPASYLFIKHYGVETEGNVKPHQVKPVLQY